MTVLSKLAAAKLAGKEKQETIPMTGRDLAGLLRDAGQLKLLSSLQEALQVEKLSLEEAVLKPGGQGFILIWPRRTRALRCLIRSQCHSEAIWLKMVRSEALALQAATSAVDGHMVTDRSGALYTGATAMLGRFDPLCRADSGPNGTLPLSAGWGPADADPATNATPTDQRSLLVLMEGFPSDLEDHVRDNGPLNAFEALQVYHQLAAVLNSLSSDGHIILHRDLKGKNIVVKILSEGKWLGSVLQVVLIDFGISVDRAKEGGHTVCGTTAYMGPDDGSAGGQQVINESTDSW